MLWLYGTKVRVISGMYQGKIGEVTSTIWSLFSGREYLITFDENVPVRWMKKYELELVDN